MKKPTTDSKSEMEVLNASGQPAAIRVDGVYKRFKTHEGLVQALDGVSFTVPRDSVFTILGPNGAGKTTLLRILTTVMTPDGGTAWIEGFEIRRQHIDVRQRIGIVAQDNHFDRYLTIWQNLALHAEMHGMRKTEYVPRIDELLDKVNLLHRKHDYIEDLSGGMQRRVALIRALIHKPSVLFLDEPTTGLDPSVRLEIWDTIQHLKSMATVILTTHYMEEADRLSDHVLILSSGQVVMTGTPDELKRTISRPDSYELHLNSAKASEYLPKLQSVVRDIRQFGESTLLFRLDRPEGLARVMDVVAWADVLSVGPDQADLETVYLTAAHVAGRSEQHA